MDKALKVLIVDSESATCKLLQRQLLRFGVRDVESCNDGDTALEKMQREDFRYDALLIDLQMSGMDGLELLDRLNELDYRGGIIIVSSLDTRVIDFTLDLVSHYNLKILGSIEKPISSSVIAFMVRRIRHSRNDKPLPTSLPLKQHVVDAIEAKKLKVYFQPIISAARNCIVTLECLARLEIDEFGVVGPESFLPIVEKYDLHKLFIEALFEHAAPCYHKIVQETGIDAALSVNLSPSELSDNNLPNILAEHVDRHNLNRQKIRLEITEKFFFSDELYKKNLSHLRIQGFELALDDYGTGYTNLHQLKSLPFNEIKLDGDLVVGMHNDKILRIIAESIQKLARELGLSLVAEGISDPRDLMILNTLGIDLYQGYLFCQPRPADDFIQWSKQWHKTIDQARAFDEKLMARERLTKFN